MTRIHKLVSLLLILLLLPLGQLAVAEEKPVITALIGVDTMPNENASVIAEISAQTGIDFQPIFVNGADYNERLNAMISGANLPDIFYFTAETGMELAQYGAILALDDLLAEYGAHILSDHEGDLDWGLNGGGTVYGIPDTPGYPMTMAIRRDWMESTGFDVPAESVMQMTMDEFYGLMHAFTYDDPDGNGTQDTFGMCFAINGMGMIYPIMNAYSVPMNGWFLDDAGKVTTYLKHPNFLKGIEFLRTMYREGLFDVDFLTVPDATAEFNNLWNGTAGAAAWSPAGMTNNWIGRYVEELQADDFIYADLTDNDGSGGGYYLSRASNYTGIAASCKDPEAAMRLLDFFFTEEGEALTYFGIEGKHYQWTDKETYAHEYLGEYTDKALQRADGGYVIWQRIRPRNNIELKSLTPITQDIIAYANEHPAPDGIYYYGVPAIRTELGGTLGDIEKEIFANLIITEGDVQAEYDTLIAKWDKAGGETLEQQATEIYNEENQ